MSDEKPVLTRDQAQRMAQDMLWQAQVLLARAGTLAEEHGLGDLRFMGLAFEPHVGWFSYDGELQEGSTWNSSECVIGSRYAAGYGGDGWGDNWPFKDS